MTNIQRDALLFAAVACIAGAGFLIATPIGLGALGLQLAAIWWHTMPRPDADEEPTPPAPPAPPEEDQPW